MTLQVGCVMLRLRRLMLLPGSLVLVSTYLVSSFPAVAQSKKTPPELAADLQRGQAALRAGDQATAEQQFRAALKLDSANVEAHANLGAIAFFQGNCGTAEPEFREALRG